MQVFDSGLDEPPDQHFIVMEYIEGQSCAEILRERGWLEVDEALPIVVGACAGLDYAHRKGVVHRDVKPGNLLRARDRVVKLADFGIAKATEQSSITQVGSVLGTAAYLAPEQGARRGGRAARADIYALGVVTYQLLSGRLPFEGASLTELAIKQQREPPATLDTLVAAVTPELADAVEIALRDRPARALPDRRRDGRARSRRARAASRPDRATRRRATARERRPPQATAADDRRRRASRRRTRAQARRASRRAAPRPGPPRRRRRRAARRAAARLAPRAGAPRRAVIVASLIVVSRRSSRSSPRARSLDDGPAPQRDRTTDDQQAVDRSSRAGRPTTPVS